ncbi:hypothetical protein DMJ13_25870 [halophilic archaeon]|nr:hypothetical protein DMJ13_25870 [halophilic archaeon]
MLFHPALSPDRSIMFNRMLNAMLLNAEYLLACITHNVKLALFKSLCDLRECLGSPDCFFLTCLVTLSAHSRFASRSQRRVLALAV